MDVAWGKQCLEQVDYVWAVIGLLPDFIRRNLLVQDFVDYSEDGRKNYENTYIRTAKWLAELDLSGMLSMAARSEKSGKIPTWCPDWSVIPRCSNLGMYYSTAGVPKEEQEAQNRQHETYEQNDNKPPLDKATGAYITWSWGT